MSKKKKNDIEQEQVEATQAETVEVEEEVQEELTPEEKLEGELKQEKDKFLRLFAEFENYKRRTAKERIELFSTASEGVMKTLLPVLDDFERALMHIEDDKEAEELRKGVLLIYQKLIKTLEQKGLKLMEVNKRLTEKKQLNFTQIKTLTIKLRKRNLKKLPRHTKYLVTITKKRVTTNLVTKPSRMAAAVAALVVV